jgi:hypothetical protein
MLIRLDRMATAWSLLWTFCLWQMMQFHDNYIDYKKVSTALTQIFPHAERLFRDSYSLDFLCLPDGHSESDLRKGIVHSLKHFITEFGRDFAFIGEEYRIQVGMKDFYVPRERGDEPFSVRAFSCPSRPGFWSLSYLRFQPTLSVP